MSAEEAVAYGLVDHVLPPRTDVAVLKVKGN